VEQAVLHFDLERWLSEQQEPSAAGIQRARRAEHGNGFHMLNADVISMPTSGSTLVRRWDWPSTHCRCHWSILTSQRSSFAHAAQVSISIPTVRYPRTSGTSADVNPRCTPGPRCISTDERVLGGSDLRFLERVVPGVDADFNWWVNRKIPRAATFFAEASWGLDNIGVSDAAARNFQRRVSGAVRRDGMDGVLTASHLEMSLILCEYDAMYEEIAFKFVQHFM